MSTLVGFLRHQTIAVLALIVALSGTAYAASTLARNSVGPAQIRTGAVATQDLKDGGVHRVDLDRKALAFVAGGMGFEEAGDPPAHSGLEIEGRDVRLPHRGKVMVTFFFPAIGADCSSGVAFLGLYWDGAPVRNSAVFVFSTSAPAPAEFVATFTSPGGQHRASARTYCPSGTPGTVTTAGASTWSVAMS
jgi:hypothetical protein